jgi:hypothetical protein
MLVHVALALLVPRTLLAMVTGGPVVGDDAVEPPAGLTIHRRKHSVTGE